MWGPRGFWVGRLAFPATYTRRGIGTNTRKERTSYTEAQLASDKAMMSLRISLVRGVASASLMNLQREVRAFFSHLPRTSV